jgi:hypothetical protein
MLSFPAAIKVYLCTVACDMRRSIDGLSMMAEHIVRCNPFSGHLLVFCNGSPQEFVRSGILRGFPGLLKGDIFGIGHGHALCFQ